MFWWNRKPSLSLLKPTQTSSKLTFQRPHLRDGRRLEAAKAGLASGERALSLCGARHWQRTIGLLQRSSKKGRKASLGAWCREPFRLDQHHFAQSCQTLSTTIKIHLKELKESKSLHVPDARAAP